jgi:chromosome segregation ATPase
MAIITADSNPMHPPVLSDPSPEELLAELSLNPTPEQLKHINERLHADNKSLHTLHLHAVERGDAEEDAYDQAYHEYWEERDKVAALRNAKAKLKKELDEAQQELGDVQEKYEDQSKEVGKYKGLVVLHFQRAQDAELELVTRENELKEARETIARLEAQTAQAPNQATSTLQVQADIDTKMEDVETEDGLQELAECPRWARTGHCRYANAGRFCNRGYHASKTISQGLKQPAEQKLFMFA